MIPINYSCSSLILLVMVACQPIFGQSNIGIGTLSPDPSAILEISSDDKGLLLPRLTNSQRNNINLPAEGLIIYNTTENQINVFADGEWETLLDAPKSIIEDADGNTYVKVNEDNTITIQLDGKLSLLIKETNDNVGIEFPNNNANIFLGTDCGKIATPLAVSNIFIGDFSGESNTNGSENIFLGYFAGKDNITGSRNVYLGAYSGISNNGDDNVFIGVAAGNNNVNGSDNVMIGQGAGANNTGSGNVFIGFNAGINTSGSNKLAIDNSSTNNPLIYGEFDNNKVTINGKLEVNGTVKLGNNGNVFSSLVTENLTYDAPSISGNDVLYHNFQLSSTISTNSVVEVTASGDFPGGIFIGQARVIAGNKVRVKFLNEGSNNQNPNSMTYRFVIFNF